MSSVKRLLRFLFVISILTPRVYAQNTLLPVVTIRATDPFATWSGDTGTFTVVRNGPTNQTLNVFYLVSGTAKNGVDYESIGSWVMIPAGVWSNTITVKPIDLGQTNGATVIVKLSPSPMAIVQNYTIGLPDTATVYITPQAITNIPPSVKLYAPADGQIFYSPTDVHLSAFAADPDGEVTSVEFFAGDNSLGVVSNGVVVDPPFPNGVGPGTRAFFVTWTNPPTGDYVLTAVATDDGGAATRSDPVKITVSAQPPPTNHPPVVKITLPQNGASFYTPVDIPICAGAYDPDGYVSTVEFFANNTSLGIKTNNPASAGPQNPFCLVWSNAPPGSYALTAVATDNEGASSFAGPVMILVIKGPPPPPTNYPPLVRITSPSNGTIFKSPGNIALYAYAFDRDGTVAGVELFDGTNDLGSGHGVCLEILPGSGGNTWPGFVCPTNYFVMIWSNAPAGTHVLTAVAADNDGVSSTSAPVNIAIFGPVPPPTNRPPVVSILASDPLALEGTNCWPWLGLDESAPSWNDWTRPTAIWRFFTNCGPKNATFTVRRSGATNDNLKVLYDIGGTGTNGVDYVPLSGEVVIPAGQRRAEITVIPLEDGPPDLSSTVVLKLSGSTNYVVGYPAKAAALILDSQAPSSTRSGLLSDQSFHLSAPGPDGAWFHVEYSTNLSDWTSICTNQVVNGSIDFIDPDAVGSQQRFYRTVPEGTPQN